jgi:hypothetical protein
MSTAIAVLSDFPASGSPLEQHPHARVSAITAVFEDSTGGAYSGVIPSSGRHESAAMRRVLDRGETGTGKEPIARAIHAGSARVRAQLRLPPSNSMRAATVTRHQDAASSSHTTDRPVRGTKLTICRLWRDNS